jgi:hypothetical protein
MEILKLYQMEILKRAKSYSNASKRCNLCIWEKNFVLCKPDIATLNCRNELVSTCIDTLTEIST